MKSGNIKFSKISFKIIKYLYAIVITIFSVFPFLWMVSTSLKPAKDIYSTPPKFITSNMNFNNYITAIKNNNLLGYVKNSLIVTLSTVAITIIIATLAAFAIGYLKLPKGKLVMKVLYSLQMLPIAVTIIPMYILCSRLGILNRYPSLILAYLAGAVPVAVILLTGFMVDIPDELGEAAKIDGCNTFNAFWRIVIPIALPGIVSASIFSFIRVWQEFIIALSFTSDSKMYTLPVGLKTYIGMHDTDWGGLMATAVVISIPAIIIFVAVQKQFVDSLAGSVKG
ncbi:MAG: carbohydrate ABC transporter permease [Vallitalea sp.]|nr:carbohydrate ABC transporter permease [Vallitalea sp.]